MASVVSYITVEYIDGCTPYHTTHTHTVLLQGSDYNNVGYNSAMSGEFFSSRVPACDASDSFCKNYQHERYAESPSDAYYVSGYCPSQLSQVPLLESENGSRSCDYRGRGNNCIAKVIYSRTQNPAAEETDV